MEGAKNKMFKKLKYCLLLVLCMVVLAACSKNDEEDETKDETKNEENKFTVSDVYENYSIDGNTIKTVFGTVEFEDYTDLTTTKSQVVVTRSSKENAVSSFLTAAKADKLDEAFIEANCKWKGINSVEEFDTYIEDLVYMLNAYNATWSDILDKFTLTDYPEEYYASIEEDLDAQYVQYLASMGYDSIDAYCTAIGITADSFRKQLYDVEGVILENIINIVIAKEKTEGVSDESTARVLEEVAFQNGYKSGDEVKEQIGSDQSELQLTVSNYLVLEWINENVKVVEDMELEAAVVDQTAGPQSGDTIATVTIKDFGVVKIRLFSQLAPKAVENFTTHSKDGYYNGLTFHRVIENFMIQGGDPNGDGTGGESIWGEPFEDEYSIQLLPIRGALCMANAGANTNGSQIFIIQSNDSNETYAANWLDMGISEALVNYYKENGGYPSLYRAHTVFGQVYEGMDVIDKVADVETDDSDKPTTDVVIESIEISTY